MTPETPPLLSEQTAFLCSILYTALYIAPFYLSPTLRATPLSSRDAPSVIQARVRAVVLTCTACSLLTAALLILHGHVTPEVLLHLLGLWPAEAVDCAKVLALVAVLFVGPLYEILLVDSEWRSISFSGLKATLLDSWIGYRNLVVAPVSEELVFRSLTISLYLLAKVDPVRIIFTTPLVFGLAHIHHLVEYLNARTPQNRRFPPAAAWASGVIRSLFQFTYTSLFGFFAAFVFLRTGSVWAPILAHAFCNWMGVPRFWGMLRPAHSSVEKITPDVTQCKRDDDADVKVRVGSGLMEKQDEDGRNLARAQFRSFALAWTVAYYALLVVGAWGFYKLLWLLTESNNALVSFS